MARMLDLRDIFELVNNCLHTLSVYAIRAYREDELIDFSCFFLEEQKTQYQNLVATSVSGIERHNPGRQKLYQIGVVGT
jgi:hypothetical protein